MTDFIRLGVIAAFFLSPLLKAQPAYLNPDGSRRKTRTICGANDMEKMSDMDATLRQMGQPIGNLRGGGLTCTGTLISKDLFITARHCDVGCAASTVSFGYTGDSTEETFRCKEFVEEGNSDTSNDYLIMRLEGEPGVKWGWYQVSAEPVSVGQSLLMIHHPSGEPMHVSRNHCEVTANDGLFLHHDCDTEPGSSGAAMIVPDYSNPSNSQIVGIHTLGGCNSDSSGSNSGPSLQHLIEVSPQLRSLANGN